MDSKFNFDLQKCKYKKHGLRNVKRPKLKKNMYP